MYINQTDCSWYVSDLEVYTHYKKKCPHPVLKFQIIFPTDYVLQNGRCNHVHNGNDYYLNNNNEMEQNSLTLQSTRVHPTFVWDLYWPNFIAIYGTFLSFLQLSSVSHGTAYHFNFLFFLNLVFFLYYHSLMNTKAQRH